MINSETGFRIGAIIISAIPLIIRFLVDFKNEESNIANNQHFLLNQIRASLSLDFSKNIHFAEDIVEINRDYYATLSDKFHEFLTSQTIKLQDFMKTSRRGDYAIKSIRTLKYLLVISSAALILLFTLMIVIKGSELNVLSWYYVFVAVAVVLILAWLVKERLVDLFHNLCTKYEIERKG
jgi:Flp pilus assembly protein TadB